MHSLQAHAPPRAGLMRNAYVSGFAPQLHPREPSHCTAVALRGDRSAQRTCFRHLRHRVRALCALHLHATCTADALSARLVRNAPLPSMCAASCGPCAQCILIAQLRRRCIQVRRRCFASQSRAYACNAPPLHAAAGRACLALSAYASEPSATDGFNHSAAPLMLHQGS